MRHERRFATSYAMAEGLAADLAAGLRADLAGRGRASLVVSGGRTPTRLYERLSRAALDWRRVSMTLADERLVPSDHRQSNARFVRERLLRNRAAAAGFVALWPGSGDPAAGASAALQHLPRPFTRSSWGWARMATPRRCSRMFRGFRARSIPPAPMISSRFRRWTAGRRAFPSPCARYAMPLRLCSSSKVPPSAGPSSNALQPGPLEDLPVRAILRQTRAPVDVYWSAEA